MDWENHLRKFEDKIIEKAKNEELTEIERTQKEKEEERIDAQIVENIFPKIEKVFKEFAKVLQLVRKWQGAKVEKTIEKTWASIHITRDFETPNYHHGETILVELLPQYGYSLNYCHEVTLSRRINSCTIRISRSIYPHYETYGYSLPRELLYKYRVYKYDDLHCETFIKVDDFTEEKLAQVLVEFSTSD